ncbi:MAG: DUF1697 domain-containing protein [Verrucomicrobia bacterium]|nr:DUF1697 domain-containing protein [Verrucomicrobiota bacterium]
MTETFIVLLRGVNVVGANSLPMKDFLRFLESAGAGRVRTYIQSGNAVFQADAGDAAGFPDRIKASIQRSLGFAPEVILLRLEELEKAVAANPYPDADADPRALHLMFLASTPGQPDLTALARLCADGEQFSLNGRVFYFFAPAGIGRSKAARQIEKRLGVLGTARNWRTTGRVLQMARELAASGQSQTVPRPSVLKRRAKGLSSTSNNEAKP